jgi:hypothetical protein
MPSKNSSVKSRAAVPASTPAVPSKNQTQPSQRRYPRPDVDRRPAAGQQLADCLKTPHDRCRAGLACAALELFVQSGRFSAVAPRQPSRQIFERIYPEVAAV